MADGTPKIEYSSDGFLATTKTFVKISDTARTGVTFEYPVIRLADLNESAQNRVLTFFNADNADAALESGIRYKLAGLASAKKRAQLVSPSVKNIKGMLDKQILDMFVAGDSEQAFMLKNEVDAASTDTEFAELWTKYLKTD